MALRVYISGPITGIKDDNVPAFREAAALLREAGFEPHDPTTIPPPSARPKWGDWMREALRMMLACDGVALLPGWERSRGATEERRIAVEVVDMPCFLIRDWLAGEADQ